MTRDTSSRTQFQAAYQNQPPWEAGHAQRALVQIAPRLHGSILDVGCGTGDNAIYFAQQGHEVYGIDFVPEVIAQARSKAQELGSCARFLVQDVLALEPLPMQFDNVIDCGLLHVLSDPDRRKYVASLASVLKPGGCLYLMCFSDKEPPGAGPRRISPAELRELFDTPWQLRSIDDVQFETAPHVPPGTFSAGGPHAYLAVVQFQP